MSIRIRVYPQNGMLGGLGYGLGMNRFGGGAVTAQRFYTNQLNNQRRLSSLQLQYERQLWNERLERTRLEERLKNPYLTGMTGVGGIGGIGGWGGFGGFGGIGGWGGAVPLASSWLGGSMLGSPGVFPYGVV